MSFGFDARTAHKAQDGRSRFLTLAGMAFAWDISDRSGDFVMLGIPRRHAHFVFGVIQSGLTSGVATVIASLSFLDTGVFLSNWTKSWAISWALMLPVVLFAAPFIRRLAIFLTKEEA
jgi:hypothetical protein